MKNKPELNLSEKMRRFTGVKVVAVFAVSLLIVLSAYWITFKSLEGLVVIVRESSKPDLVLDKVKEINSDVINAESGVRAFALTQDEKYLEPYLKLTDSIDKKMIALRMITGDQGTKNSTIDSISFLIKQKLAIYDELLSISYNSVLTSALDKIKSELPKEDSVLKDSSIASTPQKTTPEKKGFFKFLSKGPSKKELKEKAEAALKESEQSKEKISSVQKTIAGIQLQESEQLKTQTKKELALLAKDKLITFRISQLIHEVEVEESLFNQQKAEEANASAVKAETIIKILVITGALVLLLLIILILYDITRSETYRRQLSEAKAHAEKLAKIKEEFLANMSHEIRTPLSAILGYTDRLIKTDLHERQLNYAKAINTSSEHLLSLVNDILDVTKMETGNLKLEKIDFSPAQVVWEVFNAMNLKAAEKNISLECDIKNIQDVFLKGDPLRLKQVLFNIIGNAIKFTEIGEVTINCRLEKSLRPVNSPMLVFAVSDTGIGIPEEKLKTIFAQFAQVDSSISRKFGGSGLGLSISKKIIEMQGGTIQVKSKVLKGSEFIFSIPYEVGDEGRKMKDEIKLMPLEFLNSKPETFKPLSGIKILLAEDVDINRALQVEMLKELGAGVIETCDGYEVISELKAHKFDLLLLDIQMPGMSGIETINEIRTKLKSEIPALAMTANVMQKDLKRYLQAGFNDCITKPFKEKELTEKILKLLNAKSSPALEIKNEEQKNSDGISLYSLHDLRDAANGNTEFIARMIKVFIQSSEDSLQNMEAKISANEFEKVHIYAHKMIPSYNHFNMNEAIKELYALEKNGDESLVNEEIIKHFWQLKSISEQAFAGLKREIELLERKTIPIISQQNLN